MLAKEAMQVKPKWLLLQFLQWYFANVNASLSLVPIGKICWRNYQQFCAMKMPALLALATLGYATQLEMILCVS